MTPEIRTVSTATRHNDAAIFLRPLRIVLLLLLVLLPLQCKTNQKGYESSSPYFCRCYPYSTTEYAGDRNGLLWQPMLLVLLKFALVFDILGKNLVYLIIKELTPQRHVQIIEWIF